MSTGATYDPATRYRKDAGPDGSTTQVPGELPHPTAELVQATRDEVRQITLEIAELSRSEVAVATYFNTFLQHVTTALASVAGAVWQVDSQGGLLAITRINAPITAALDERHQHVLQRVVSAGRPITLAPHSTSTDLAVTNPTDHVLLLVPLRLEARVTAIMAVFQRPRPPATQRGYMNYLLQVRELAEAFLASQQLRALRAHQEWTQQLEQFLTRIHRDLSVDQTAYRVVNEARQLLDVDRVSLALGSGRQCRLHVVSGLDNVDRRAEQVRQLGRLSARVIKGREPVWLDTHESSLPPQIEAEWNRYVDISHVRRCGVFPLLPPGSSDPDRDTSEPFGALLFEQLRDAAVEQQQTRRIEQVCRHSTLAVYHALQHENLFLLPLWRLLGSLCEALGGRHFSKTLLAIVLIMVSVVGLVTARSDFSVSARGKLQPELRRTVFAGESGIITGIHVEHGQQVQAGQVLAELRNTDLDVDVLSLVGKQTATREQILSLQRALLDNPRLDTGEQNRLNGELLQLQQLAQSTDRQLQLLRQKEEQLLVRAEQAGQIVTWHVQEKLRQRPVQKGQALMAIVDPDAAWELELYVPVRHSGHVLCAARHNDQPLQVTFMLASHPGQPLTGTVKAIDHVAIEHEEVGSAVRIRVAVDARALPERKADATVAAKIHCGQRSLGYAWFHDFLDTVQSRVLFWL